MFAYLKVIITDDNVGAHLYKRITFLFSAFFCVLLKCFFQPTNAALHKLDHHHVRNSEIVFLRNTQLLHCKN